MTLEYGQDINPLPVEKPLEVQADPDATTVVTGPLKIRLSHSEFRLFDSVWLDLDGDGIFPALDGFNLGSDNKNFGSWIRDRPC